MSAIFKCPKGATVKARRQCLDWLDACKNLGWSDKDLPELESLWWRYHDGDGAFQSQEAKNAPEASQRVPGPL